MVDVLVLGGGHAGVEAALACARMKQKTMLLTMHITLTASMRCDPSVGGPAKGIVVREIDALGGEMGKAADHTALQLKMLNTNKGPGVQSLRVQSDKLAYRKYMQDVCLHTDNLEVKECIVEQILFNDKKVTKTIENKITSAYYKLLYEILLPLGYYEKTSGKINLKFSAKGT